MEQLLLVTAGPGGHRAFFLFYAVPVASSLPLLFGRPSIAPSLWYTVRSSFLFVRAAPPERIRLSRRLADGYSGARKEARDGARLTT